MTVRSGKCDANVLKPLASMGWAIMNRGRRPSAVGSGPWTSLTMSASVVSSLCVVMAVSVGSFLGGLARPCLLRRSLWMQALGKHLLACRAVPLLVLVVGDLALDEQLCELSALRLALEGHQAEASKHQARHTYSYPPA